MGRTAIMGRHQIPCWIAIFFILLQTEVSLSKKPGKKPGSNPWSSGSQRPGNKPHNPGYPQQNPGYPQNPVYPPHNPGYPARNPAYPPHNPGYPAQNPGYPHANPGYPARNPGYPAQNPGYPHANPAYPAQNPGWGQYNHKPWKPKPPKSNMKQLAGAAIGGAVAGAVGSYVLGSAMSNMHLGFRNPNEERWWYENRNNYPDRVYYQQSNQPVSRDVFVRDCTNVTVNEYIEPGKNGTADETETRVVTQVVHQMCTEQYRLMSGVVTHLANPSMCLIITLVLCFLIH